MQIFICDDNVKITKQIHDYILTFFSNHKLMPPNITIFHTGEALLQSQDNKDIVFLDVEMEGINGIYVGQELKKRNKDTIIFMVTSFLEYLDDAMKFDVFRYMYKPLDKQRFLKNLDDAMQLYNSLSKTITVEAKDSNYIINTNEIIMVESTKRRTILRTNDKNIITTNSMDYWEEILPRNQFYRSHKSFIVNMAYISNYSHDLIFFRNCKASAYLTRRKYTDFKKCLVNYLEFIR